MSGSLGCGAKQLMGENRPSAVATVLVSWQKHPLFTAGLSLASCPFSILFLFPPLSLFFHGLLEAFLV